MTLGEKIRQMRMYCGMSQEKLAEKIGVSRQAVCKWEQGQSMPDTANLLALAQIFGISSDELVGLKAGENNDIQDSADTVSFKKSIFVILLIVIIAAAAAAFILLRDNKPSVEDIGEFAFVWNDENKWEHLSIGVQAGSFPWGISLSETAMGEYYDTDFSSMTLNIVYCGPLTIQYLHINEDPVRETITQIYTLTGGYATPRDIRAGDNEGKIITAYGDDLVYMLKEHGSDIICRHDHIYVYAPEGMNSSILFYISEGHVSGIKIKAGDELGNEAYKPDNLYIFPMKDGKPDFSMRSDPPQESISSTRAAYIAFNALENDMNLSEEEKYEYQRQIYEYLPDMDWQSYGKMGPAEEEDETIAQLLRWLISQKTLSVEKIKFLQLGWCRSNLDGWAAESYSMALGNAFINYTSAFVKSAVENDFTSEEQLSLITAAAFGCPNKYDEAVAAAEELVYDHKAFYSEAEIELGIKFLEIIEQFK